ncbi:MAG: AAA family ATPase [Fimbriimonadaceae bacterium]|jgi:proteasome-associated ATPase|nr:AAA family ATPase [Fimbriimonadaceae bacterium]
MDSPLERANELLQRIDATPLTEEAKLRNYLAALREEIKGCEKQSAELEELNAKYEEAYQKLTAPANRVGIFLRELEGGKVLVAMGDTEYVALVDPNLDISSLKAGGRVRLNEAYAVIGLMEDSTGGTLFKVSDVMPDGRLRVGGDMQGQSSRLIERAGSMGEVKVKAGDEVRLDPTGRFAIEHFAHQDTKDYFIEDVPETPWEKVGGQEEAIRLIRETIENPLLYPEIYEKFDKKPVKGILLYGPPGCGKTLIGKATAYNLAKEYSKRKGIDVKECFLHISGPKILNMWLGETERMVREIFTTARSRARDGQLVVVFIDEAESILRTRSGGRYLNISNTVVPQFCAEMDGLVELENVVLIITSNRPDYIDPAILRPERIDRKVKVVRPNEQSTRDILSLYLHDNLPLDPRLLHEHESQACAKKALIESTSQTLWRKVPATEFLKIQLRSGATQTLYWSDLVSGALLKSVVDRAKDVAIRRAIADRDTPHGLTTDDLLDAVSAEYRENEIFPKSDAVEDWLKLLDFEPDQVVGVRPVKETRADTFIKRSIV